MDKWMDACMHACSSIQQNETKHEGLSHHCVKLVEAIGARMIAGR